MVDLTSLRILSIINSITEKLANGAVPSSKVSDIEKCIRLIYDDSKRRISPMDVVAEYPIIIRSYKSIDTTNYVYLDESSFPGMHCRYITDVNDTESQIEGGCVVMTFDSSPYKITIKGKNWTCKPIDQN